jgi:hypothetical protein
MIYIFITSTTEHKTPHLFYYPATTHHGSLHFPYLLR